MNSPSGTENPYLPPQIDESKSTEDVSSEETNKSSYWNLFFVALVNMIEPFLFANIISSKKGMIGVVIGVFAVLAITWFVHRFANHLVKYIVLGGGLVAFSQFFPVLQMMAGSIGIWLSDKLFGKTWRPPQDDGFADKFDMVDSIPSGVLVTVVVGSLLLIVSFLVGLGLRSIHGMFVGPKRGKRH